MNTTYKEKITTKELPITAEEKAKIDQNINEENKVWYVDYEGKITTNNGADIIGVKPVITINC